MNVTDGMQDAPESVSASLPNVMSVVELAALLRVHPRTVAAAIRAGDIPGVRRVGRQIRIDRNTVLRWLATGKGP